MTNQSRWYTSQSVTFGAKEDWRMCFDYTDLNHGCKIKTPFITAFGYTSQSMICHGMSLNPFTQDKKDVTKK
jgi:hypothetical protein